VSEAASGEDVLGKAVLEETLSKWMVDREKWM
jgi:hypothetical protein